jgi:hypothetical protein
MDDEGAAMAVLGNRRVYVDEAVFFRLLQDVGQQMSNKEKDRFVKNKSRAAVKGNVHFEGLMYPYLHKLTKEMYYKMSESFSPGYLTMETKQRQSIVLER